MAEHSSPPTCAVIVVNYASSELLDANLRRVSSENPDLGVYVVDNATSYGERERVRRQCETYGWTGLFPDVNLGFGAGCNIAARRAIDEGAAQLLLLNPDAYLDASSLSRLRRAVASDPQALVAPTVKTADGTIWSAGVDLLLDDGTMRGWMKRADSPPARSMPWLSGACLLMSAQLWGTVDGFDSEYFLYWEDVDLSARVQRHGGRVELLPSAVAVHDEGATHRSGSATAGKSPTYYYYNVRNRMLFASKNLDADGIGRWSRTSMQAAYHVLLRGGRRQLIRPDLTLWPIARGLVAGAQHVRRHRPVRITGQEERHAS